MLAFCLKPTEQVELLRPVASEGESIARCACKVPVAILITMLAAALRSFAGAHLAPAARPRTA